MDDRLLASVRDGAIEHDELLSASRELAADTEGREALFDGSRERLLAAIGSGYDDFAALKDLFGRLAGLAWAMSPGHDVDVHHVLAIRMDAMTQLAADYESVGDAHRLDQLRAQPHVEKVICLVHQQGGAVRRDELLEQLSLKQANGTRLLLLLERAGLLRRRKMGTRVEVTLTTLGQKTAMTWRSPPVTPPRRPEPSAAILMKGGAPRGMINSQWPISTEAHAVAVS